MGTAMVGQKKIYFCIIGEAWSRCGYTVVEIAGNDIKKLCHEKYALPLERAYIRKTPKEGEWLVMRLDGYKSEIKTKLHALTMR